MLIISHLRNCRKFETCVYSKFYETDIFNQENSVLFALNEEIMPWIALALVCVALVVLTYYSPKIGFASLSGLGVLLIALYFLNLDESENVELPVPRDQLVLSDMNSELSYADNWRYSGRISNSSQKTLTDIEIKIVLYDCPDVHTETDNCLIIGDVVEFVPVTVPPYQARDFVDNADFRNANPKGTRVWEYELVNARFTD